MLRVVILQHRLLHYRLELFSLLRGYLAERGIELVLVHGQASESERSRDDEGELPWATRVVNKFWRILGKDLIWQPFPPCAREAVLCVMMQENRILSNYPLQLRRLLGGPRLGYWGHGKNFQSKASHGLRERWKQLLLTKVDWWFAYTDLTVKHLLGHGFPIKQITNLQNAIDVSGFQRELAAVSADEVARLRDQLQFGAEARVGVFCGSLYAEKKIGLLLASADAIRAAVPTFELVVIGDGPSACEVRAAAETRPWIHVMGVRRGAAKASLFRLAHIQLNPGAVGLHVLDAFSAGLPMITTSNAMHGPEIAYLHDGVNGIITVSDDVTAYASPVISLLMNEEKRSAMAAQCLADASRYTVENMAKTFCEGIVECLGHFGLAETLTTKAADRTAVRV